MQECSHRPRIPLCLLEHSADLGQRQVIFLQPLDDLEPVQMLVPVVGPRSFALRRGQQPLLYVVTDGSRTYAGSVSELGQIEGRIEK